MRFSDCIRTFDSSNHKQHRQHRVAEWITLALGGFAMRTCFVIQPFDSGKFDKRFAEVYKPALQESGLEAYRVDEDPSVDVPIEAIETGITESAICLADITTDNPNVWYELGYASAAARPVIMICSDERKGNFPFDIQHRTVIRYSSESPGDFRELGKRISQRAEALLTKALSLQRVAETQQVAPTGGLSQQELLVLAVLAGDTAIPEIGTSLYSVKVDAERAGLTPIGFGLAFRRLQKKEFIEPIDVFDEVGDTYQGVQLTAPGWAWIEDNERLFILSKNRQSDPEEFNDDEIPF